VFDRHFTATHTSSENFATFTGSALHALLRALQPGHGWLTRFRVCCAPQIRAVHPRVRSACGYNCLKQATRSNSSGHTPKGTRSRMLERTPAWRSHCMDAVGFRIYFTPLAGVLFTVPSRYSALSVTTSRLAWTVVRPDSHRIARVPWYSRHIHGRFGRRVQDCHLLWCAIPDASRSPKGSAAGRQSRRDALTTPPPQRLPAWHGESLACSPFRSPLLRAGYYFLRLVRCFSSPRALSLIGMPGSAPGVPERVAPFGNGGIEA
jgi:hypothetical protein